MISAKPSPSASNNTWKCDSAEAVTEIPAAPSEVRNSVTRKAPAHIVVRNSVTRKAPAHSVARKAPADIVVCNNVDAVVQSMDAVVLKKGAVVRVAVRMGAVDRLKHASRFSGHRGLPGGFFRGFGGWLCYQRARWMRRNRN
jgi:hypothetical protein